MQISGITNICNYGCTISDLSAYSYSSDIISPKTIRSRGQFTMQRFFYIKGGSTKFVLNDEETIICNTGDILYLPPDSTYVSYWEQNPDNAAILIKFNLRSERSNLLLSDKMFVVDSDNDEMYLKEFTKLYNCYSEGHLGYKIKCQSIFLNIIYSLISKLIVLPNMPNTSQVYKGILYIENNYMQKINIEELAKMCSLCPSTFRKQFHDIIGMSPIEYKNYLIAQKAAELLKTGEFSVSEVAAEVGIDDIYYFNRMFKKYFLVPPGKYRVTPQNEK